MLFTDEVISPISVPVKLVVHLLIRRFLPQAFHDLTTLILTLSYPYSQQTNLLQQLVIALKAPACSHQVSNWRFVPRLAPLISTLGSPDLISLSQTLIPPYSQQTHPPAPCLSESVYLTMH
jgi:hypothetical protein